VGIWFTGAVAAFTGIDGKSYGPFAKGENAVIRKEKAERLAVQGLASPWKISSSAVTSTAKTANILAVPRNRCRED